MKIEELICYVVKNTTNGQIIEWKYEVHNRKLA